MATIDRIAAALGTTFSTLVGVSADPSPDGVEVWSTPNGSWAHLLSAVETEDVSVELWKWRLVGDDRYQATPAAGAPDWMIHVSRGNLRVRQGTKDLQVGEGESARLPSSPEFTFQAATATVDFLRVATIIRRPEE